MGVASKAEAEVTWAQVHAFRLRRHHLVDRAPREAMVRVAGEAGGMQAQVMSAAEMQLAVRCECSAADVQEALWRRRTLVKTWLMRGTLHLIPASDLPLYCAAMELHSGRVRRSWLKYMRMTEPELTRLIDDLGEAVAGAPVTREEIVSRVAPRHPAHVREILSSGWGGLLKPVARRGLLCFGPRRGPNVTFVNPRSWLGEWRPMDPDEALAEVGRRYLRAYGPATQGDFVRWGGGLLGVRSQAWPGVAEEVATVRVEGRPAQALRADLEALTDAGIEQAVQLLPSFDPYLMGHDDRGHMLDREHSARVSRVAGWISAVVLVDGRVEGTWTHTTKGGALEITLNPFRKLPVRVIAQVRRRARTLAQAIGLAKAEVTIRPS